MDAERNERLDDERSIAGIPSLHTHDPALLIANTRSCSHEAASMRSTLLLPALANRQLPNIRDAYKIGPPRPIVLDEFCN